MTRGFREKVNATQDEWFRPGPTEIGDGVEECHIGSTNDGIGDLCVKRADTDELDGAIKRAGEAILRLVS